MPSARSLWEEHAGAHNERPCRSVIWPHGQVQVRGTRRPCPQRLPQDRKTDPQTINHRMGPQALRGPRAFSQLSDPSEPFASFPWDFPRGTFHVCFFGYRARGGMNYFTVGGKKGWSQTSAHCPVGSNITQDAPVHGFVPCKGPRARSSLTFHHWSLTMTLEEEKKAEGAGEREDIVGTNDHDVCVPSGPWSV